MSDLVDRLRKEQEITDRKHGTGRYLLLNEAADRIAWLEDQNHELTQRVCTLYEAKQDREIRLRQVLASLRTAMRYADMAKLPSEESES